MLNPMEAYLMFVQTNSEAERKRLLKIILTDPKATLSFLRNDTWNYQKSNRLLITGFNLLIKNKDMAILLTILNDAQLFKKLGRSQRVKLIQTIIDMIVDGNSLNEYKIKSIFHYTYTPWESQKIFENLKKLFTQNISSNFFVKICEFFETYATENDLWEMIYHIMDQSNVDLAKELMVQQPIYLTPKMIETLDAFLLANKLMPKQMMSFSERWK